MFGKKWDISLPRHRSSLETWNWKGLSPNNLLHNGRRQIVYSSYRSNFATGGAQVNGETSIRGRQKYSNHHILGNTSFPEQTRPRHLGRYWRNFLFCTPVRDLSPILALQRTLDLGLEIQKNSWLRFHKCRKRRDGYSFCKLALLHRTAATSVEHVLVDWLFKQS